MDARFQPIMLAAWSGRLEEFVSLLVRSPDLVTARSSCSHPTLLQFLVLDGGEGKIAEPERFMRVLVDRGADLNEPIVAAASIGSEPMASFLLAAGAMVESGAPWTPLEESVYWAHSDLSFWLRSVHGAQVLSLRAAAGLGEVAEMERFLDGDLPAPGAGPALSANVRETQSTQRIRVGRRQRKRTCWDCEREWKRMVVPLEPGGPSEARQLLRTRR